ncbi:hypothetical protein [Kribbella sp. NPDC051770]|uniref:hypothetical protein n=1 Tax=Kribbella sp. NPDC051770 TaxID=3155413 RepID=UPI00342B22A5
MTPTDKDFNVLRPSINREYGPKPLPSHRDHQIHTLLSAAVPGLSFQALKLKMPLGAAGVLATYAERAASLAVRDRDANKIRTALIATAIALDLTDDFRDVIPSLALLYRAAELIDLDPPTEFRTAATLLDLQAPELTQFPRRSPADRSIQAMAYIESTDDQGFRFQRTW